MTVLLEALVACENVGVHAISGCSRTGDRGNSSSNLAFPSNPITTVRGLARAPPSGYDAPISPRIIRGSRHPTNKAPPALSSGASIPIVLCTCNRPSCPAAVQGGRRLHCDSQSLQADGFQTVLTRGSFRYRIAQVLEHRAVHAQPFLEL